MNTSGNLPLIIVALLPAIVLCIYVFKKDKVEKEPVWLLLKLLICGALICFPAATLEGILLDMIDASFPQQVALISQGIIPQSGYYLYTFMKNFVGIALVEEGLKFLVLIYITRKNKDFNSLFDGLIYAIFVSLGFAAFENVLYVLKYGMTTGILRAVLSVPGHMFFAVFMGYYYSMWHITDKANEVEKELKAKGIISQSAVEFNPNKNIIMTLLLPVLAHGWYDFCCTLGTSFATLMLLAFVIFLYVYCFAKIKEFSKADNYENFYIGYMIEKKYPGALDQYQA